jgi:hypothetical protein
MNIQCLNCSSTFKGTGDRKFCSRSCSASYNNKGKKRTRDEVCKIRESLGKTLSQKEIFAKTAVFFRTCIQCSKSFWTRKSDGKVCSKECQNLNCAKIFSNRTRKSTTYRGKPTKTFLASQPGYVKPESKRKRRLQTEKPCLICDTVFVTKAGKSERKTCSKDCHYHLLSGKIGHTTHPEHICKDGKTIILGSSWEKQIAVFLDEQDIEWTRPTSLEYVDENGKSRKYFPDFYLPEHNIYLDPKNSMKIKADQHKLNYFQDKIVLYYGKVSHIKQKLVGTLGLEPRPPGNPPAPLRSGV